MAIVILPIARRASRWMRHFPGNLEMEPAGLGSPPITATAILHRAISVYIQSRVSLIGTQDAGHRRLGVGGSRGEYQQVPSSARAAGRLLSREHGGQHQIPPLQVPWRRRLCICSACGGPQRYLQGGETVRRAAVAVARWADLMLTGQPAVPPLAPSKETWPRGAAAPGPDLYMAPSRDGS
ncbi:uncharacterized protein TrAtP1_002068 [Trichoderma atroviride]|uniref:uncharacterized protein n=1 Tax=Hypocrea atroviridis TaxID=63577 RepID=UPI0033204B3E|nr:hypothetical protein TrAtP1_002068 [Trichoderma atroviride]